MQYRWKTPRALLGFLALAVASACGTPASSTSGPAGSTSAPAASGGEDASAPSGVDTSAVPSSSASATPSTPDGAPTRAACTSTFGNGLTSTHGRLDGYLVSIVPKNTHDCNADSSHLHLQVQAEGGVYDVSVNLDALEASVDVAGLPGGQWTEGWHANEALDYPADLQLHAPVFVEGAPAARRTELETKLATVNHVSIFATGYGSGGAHLVHRQGGSRDGAIILDPLSTKPHVIAFRFAKDSF